MASVVWHGKYRDNVESVKEMETNLRFPQNKRFIVAGVIP